MTKAQDLTCVRLIKRSLNEEYFQPVIGVDVLLIVGIKSRCKSPLIEFYRNHKLEYNSPVVITTQGIIKLPSMIEGSYSFVLYVKINPRDFYKISADDSCILTSWTEQETEEA